MDKRLIAPFVIAGLLVLIIVLYGVGILEFLPLSGFTVILSVLIIVALGIVFAVLYQRYKEIKKGEEDDLSKY